VGGVRGWGDLIYQAEYNIDRRPSYFKTKNTFRPPRRLGYQPNKTFFHSVCSELISLSSRAQSTAARPTSKQKTYSHPPRRQTIERIKTFFHSVCSELIFLSSRAIPTAARPTSKQKTYSRPPRRLGYRTNKNIFLFGLL
jgi:hypothetical protein